MTLLQDVALGIGAAPPRYCLRAAGRVYGPGRGLLSFGPAFSANPTGARMADTDLKVLGICGSLRKKSFNMAALRAAGDLMPPGMSLHITSIADLPLFNQDVLDAGM